MEGFLMRSSIFWRRPGVDFPSSLDTMLFDIDGVLVQTIDSFHATDIAAAEYVAGTIFGLDWGQHEGKSLFTHDDVLAFKQAGGYNNDWICVTCWQRLALLACANGKVHRLPRAAAWNGRRSHELPTWRVTVELHGYER